jgi:hypothetical protein
MGAQVAFRRHGQAGLECAVDDGGEHLVEDDVAEEATGTVVGL